MVILGSIYKSSRCRVRTTLLEPPDWSQSGPFRQALSYRGRPPCSVHHVPFIRRRWRYTGCRSLIPGGTNRWSLHRMSRASSNDTPLQGRTIVLTSLVAALPGYGATPSNAHNGTRFFGTGSFRAGWSHRFRPSVIPGCARGCVGFVESNTPTTTICPRADTVV